MLTRVGNHTIHTACIAMHTDKTSRKDTTIQECAKLTFHESRRIPVTFALPRKESFQMSGNDTIEGIFFGIARPVDVLGSHEAISGCKLQCITPTPSQQQLARLQRGKIQLDRD